MAMHKLDPRFSGVIESLADFLKDPVVELVRVNAVTGLSHTVSLGKNAYVWIDSHPRDDPNFEKNSGILIKALSSYYAFVPINQFQPKYQKQILAQLRKANVL